MPEIEYIDVTTPEDYLKSVTIRSIVFMDEQNISFYDEFDEHDLKSSHFLITVDGEPAGTARMRSIGGYAKFERLAVRKEYRKLGLGKGILTHVLKHIDNLGHQKTLINAQTYLIKFYEGFGFVREGKEFMDAGLPHYRMTRTTDSSPVETKS